MKHSIPMKFLAFLLSGCMLVCCILSAVGVIVVGQQGFYSQSLEDIQDSQIEDACLSMSYYLAELYALETLSNIPQDLWYPMELMSEINSHLYYSNASNLVDGKWHYTLTDPDENLLQSSGSIPEGAQKYTITTSFPYTQLVAIVSTPYNPIEPEESLPPEADAFPESVTQPDDAATESEDIAPFSAQDIRPGQPQQVPDEGSYDWFYEWDDFAEETHYTYYLRDTQTPAYTVTIYVEEAGYRVYSDAYYAIMDFLWVHRYTMIGVLIGSLLLFAICVVYLFCAAGRKPGTRQVIPTGMNRLPLDLYMAGAGTAVFLLVVLFVELLNWSISSSLNYGGLVLCVLIALAGSIIALGFLYALAAQVKIGSSFWWRKSILGRLLGLIGRGLRFVFAAVRGVYRLLPIIWRWLLIGVGMGLALLLTLILWCENRYYYPDGPVATLFLLLIIAACAVVVCYGAYGFGTILEGAKRMAKGDLHSKINTKYLWGGFADCANQLNALSDVAEIAAKNQLKSERMKTELITNVSHDIKTPLTSIINYVDLMQKAQSQQETEEYLEVLARQSLRLKKLIEDLMEMSKASTGNLNVSIEQVDAVETVNQALGEFADKLASVQLIPIFRQPENPVYMRCDGRLAWRVLSNLLGNAVKYALPGTRLYIDLIELEGKVLISLKNISREELNISADELMERFVRGDASRNTEGSGLGLNIAKSLMELQHGQLQLLVDGDLFKATLVFPAAGEE